MEEFIDQWIVCLTYQSLENQGDEIEINPNLTEEQKTELLERIGESQCRIRNLITLQ